jgi:DNA-binding transcriptional LysR family regulator
MDIDLLNIRRLDFSTLLVFVELVQQRRTTSVAKRLSLSQSAVSHALGRLRVIFDDPLFLRKPNGLQPTQRALDLLPKINALIHLAQEAVVGTRRFAPSSSARLFRIAANDLVGTLYGVPLLGELTHRAPNIRTAFRFAVGQDAFDALREDLVDLALGRFYVIPQEFEAMPLSYESFVVVARARHPSLKRRLSLQTYCRLEHVIVSFSGGMTGVVDLALKQRGLSRRVRASLPLFLTVLATVSETDSIATVPARLATRYAKNFGLRIYDTPIDIEGFQVTLVRYARSRDDAGLDWLVQQVRQVAERIA